MQNDFSFRALVTLRNEDKIFSLLRRDGKYFELYMAFLHKTFDVHDRKEVKEEELKIFLRKFLKDEILSHNS